MASPTYITDGVTDALRTSQNTRMSDAWSVDTITDGFSDGSKSLAGFSNFFWCKYPLITDGITDEI